jgi:hypothetical protein
METLQSLLSRPERNDRTGIITVPHFKKLILAYCTIVKPIYVPKEFKEWYEMNGDLSELDWELMNTKPHPKWKHHIDAAKQQLWEYDKVIEKLDTPPHPPYAHQIRREHIGRYRTIYTK